MTLPKDFWVLHPEHLPIATYLGLSPNPRDWTIAVLRQIASASDWEEGAAYNLRIAQRVNAREEDVHALVDHILAVQGLLEIAEEKK